MEHSGADTQDDVPRPGPRQQAGVILGSEDVKIGVTGGPHGPRRSGWFVDSWENVLPGAQPLCRADCHAPALPTIASTSATSDRTASDRKPVPLNRLPITSALATTPAGVVASNSMIRGRRRLFAPRSAPRPQSDRSLLPRGKG